MVDGNAVGERACALGKETAITLRRWCAAARIVMGGDGGSRAAEGGGGGGGEGGTAEFGF